MKLAVWRSQSRTVSIPLLSLSPSKDFYVWPLPCWKRQVSRANTLELGSECLLRIISFLIFLSFFSAISLCVWIFCPHICMCTMCMAGALRGQKRTLELGLQMVVSYHGRGRGCVCVLGIEPWYSAWVTSGISWWTSLQPQGLFLNETECHFIGTLRCRPNEFPLRCNKAIQKIVKSRKEQRKYSNTLNKHVFSKPGTSLSLSFLFCNKHFQPVCL